MEEERKKLWSRKKLLVKCSDIIFMITIVLVALLRNMEIIKFGITWLVAISLVVYWFISVFYFGKAESAEINKSKTKRIYLDADGNPCDIEEHIPMDARKEQIKKSNKVFIDRLILVFVFMFFALPIIMIDKNVSTKTFLRTANETVGVILDVNKYIQEERESDGDGGYEKIYEFEFVYAILYKVKDVEYFYNHSTKNDYSSRGAAENAKASYNVNDELKIYYQIDDPEDVMVEAGFFPAELICILLGITFGVELIWLLVLKRNYDKDCEKLAINL